MVTRRTVLGAGLAVTSLAYTTLACTAGFGAHDPTPRRAREAQSIDALLFDEGMEMPRQMAAFINASTPTLPVIGIQFDAAAHVRLKRVLDKSNAIVGISSGATLFCLERIAWDHGFRLTGRSQHVGWQDVAAFLNGAHSAVAYPSPLTRAYSPSRADGMLHAWVMHKSANRKV